MMTRCYSAEEYIIKDVRGWCGKLLKGAAIDNGHDTRQNDIDNTAVCVIQWLI